MRARLIILFLAWVAASALVSQGLPATAAVTSGPAIVVRDTTSGSTTRATSVDVPRPTGTRAGDLLVARIANRADVQAESSSPGWTEVASLHSAFMLKSVLLTRVATSSEPSAYTFTLTSPSPMAASVTSVGNVDTRRPVDDYSGAVNGESAVFATPPVQATKGNELAMWFGSQLSASSDCSDGTISQPEGFVDTLNTCLPSQAGLAVSTGHRTLGAPMTWSGWDGRSESATTNIAQVLTLRPAYAVQVADVFASRSVNVGRLWDGYTRTGEPMTNLPDSELHEPSGLAASRVNADVQYVHSESDNGSMLAVNSRSAEVVGRYNVEIPQQWDWEDIATGPCPSGSCIFAADIGRSNGKPLPPSAFAVYRVTEPALASGHTSGALTGDWFRFRYPDEPHEAEALMVHPVTGRIYVVTKDADGVSGVFAFPSKLPEPSSTTITTLTRVATLHVPVWTGNPNNQHAKTWYAQVTAASIHPAANRFLIRTPYKVWEYRGAPGASFDSALAASPVSLTSPTGEPQGEAIEYAPDGSAYYTLGERQHGPYTLKRVDRR